MKISVTHNINSAKGSDYYMDHSNVDPNSIGYSVSDRDIDDYNTDNYSTDSYNEYADISDELWDIVGNEISDDVIDVFQDQDDPSVYVFVYNNSTPDYEEREDNLIYALESNDYNAEYDTNNGSNVIALRVTPQVAASKSITAAEDTESDTEEDSTSEEKTTDATDPEDYMESRSQVGEDYINELSDKLNGMISDQVEGISDDSTITWDSHSDSDKLLLYIQKSPEEDVQQYDIPLDDLTGDEDKDSKYILDAIE